MLVVRVTVTQILKPELKTNRTYLDGVDGIHGKDGHTACHGSRGQMMTGFPNSGNEDIQCILLLALYPQRLVWSVCRRSVATALHGRSRHEAPEERHDERW